MLANLLGRLPLFFGRFDDVAGRSDAVSFGPSDFFTIRMAAAVVPTGLGRRTAARIVLARERTRVVFGAELHHRNSSNSTA
jgi:hypothetical protein